MKETELAAAVVAYFDGRGCAVFPEVTVFSGGDRADIVAVNPDAFLDVVECKVRPCHRLLRQGMGWKGMGDRCWVAYEPPRRGEVMARWLARFKSEGLGVLYVVRAQVTVAAEPEHESAAVGNAARPWSRWGLRDRLVSAITPLHAAMGEAGNAESRYYTPFRHTCDNLRRALEADPGLTIRDGVERIAHHYTTDKVARSALLAWIRKGMVAGVEARRDGRRMRLYACAASGTGSKPKET